MAQINAEELRKLDTLIRDAVAMKERHKVEQEGLREAITAIAESTGLKKKAINAAIRVAYKANYQEENEFYEEVNTILEGTGRV